MKLTAKLGLGLVALALFVLATTLSILYISERRHLLAQMERERAGALHRLGRVCANAVIDNNEIAGLTYLKTFVESAQPGIIESAGFIDTKNHWRFHTDFLRKDFARYRKPAATLPASSAERLVISEPISQNGWPIGTAVITYNRAAIDAELRRIQSESKALYRQAALGGIILGMLCAVLLARMLMGPIRQLHRAAQEIGSGKLEHRIVLARNDELGDLAREFNAMAAKLADLDKLKNDFFSQITHDLLTPVSTMRGFMELMQEGKLGAVTSQQTNSLQIAQNSGVYLTELIENILDLAKLESGTMQLQPQPVALARTVASIAEAMKIRADEYKVALKSGPIPETLTVTADPQALRRVLLNLVANALNFTPEGGTVTVDASRSPRGEVVIAVSDTGVGIAPDKVHLLFQKMSQVHSPASDSLRRTKGTGLGLAICKQLVEAHGGRIWVESTPGQGARFLFTFSRPNGA